MYWAFHTRDGLDADLHHYVTRNLRRDIEREQNSKAVVVLQPDEMKVLFEIV